MRIESLNETQVREIYENQMTEDFPAAEIKPLSRIVKMMQDRNYFCYGYFDGSALMAYAFFICGKSARLLDYLAVTASARGAGIGGKFLAALFEMLDEQVLWVESEAVMPDDDAASADIKERRIAFYARTGFTPTIAKACLFGVTYRVLVRNLAPDTDAATALQDFYRDIVPAFYYETEVSVWEEDFE